MNKIPVILVTGFLGSGKTTLLRRIAETHPHWHLVFLVNEFGDIDVDGDSLANTGRPTQSVVGGSIFCDCKAADFIRVMHQTVLAKHKARALDALVIETSGIADPRAIGQLMNEHGLGYDFEIRRIVSVVAPARFIPLLRNLPVVKAQVQSSDLVVINKTDTATSDVIDEVELTIRALNPSAEIIRSKHCRISFELPPCPPPLPDEKLSTCRANPFDTIGLVWPESCSIETFRAWLNGLPPQILRVKGRIRTPEGFWHVERTLDSSTVHPSTDSGFLSFVLIAHEDDSETLHSAAASLLY